MRQLNKQQVKNGGKQGNQCIPHKSSKRNFVRKKNKKFRSKTIQKKKLTKKSFKKHFLCKDLKFRKKGFWLNNIFTDEFRDQDYKYVMCNAPCLECSKCGFISSRIKCSHKHSSKHYELKTPRTLQLKKSILNCSYCPHVHTNLTDLLKHVEYVHLEKQDYKKNKVDTLKKRLKEIHLDIKNLNLELSALNLCHHSDKTDKPSNNGIIDDGKSDVSEHISNISSESVNMPPKIKTDGIQSNSKISTRTYSSVCKTPSKIQLISDNKNIHNKTEFVSSATLPKKSSHQQVKLEVHVEKTQQYVPTFLKKEKSSKNIHTACNICSTKFSNIEDLERHKESGIHDKMTFVCPTCSSVFSNIKDLKKHKNKTKHKKIKLLCTVCFAPFPSKYEIDLHIKFTGHKTVDKVPKGSVLCFTCNSIFSSKIMLDQHVLKSHTSSANSNSSLCGSTFGTKNSLDQQKAKSKHEVENNLCTICLKGFNSRANLNSHMKNGVHETVEYPIQRMLSEKCLQSHTIHEEQKPENDLINLKQFLTNTEQNITCILCLRHFPTEENLKEHMESDSHNSLSASVHNNTLHTPKIGIERHSNNKQKLETVFPTQEVAVKDNSQKQSTTNCWQHWRHIFSLNESTKVEEHSVSVHEVTSNKNSLDHDITLDRHKSVNVVFESEFTDVKPQLETTVTKKIICTICQKKFAAEIDLEQHMNSKAHKYETTRNIFANEFTDVGQELRSDNQKKITCTMCYKQFVAEVSLKQHMENTHKSFSSPVHEVTSKKSLEHAITLDRQKSENLSSLSQELGNSKQRKITCTLCQKQFSDEASLKQHTESSVHKTVPSSTFGFLMDNISQKQQTNHNTQKSENISSVSDVGKEVGSSKQRKIPCTLCQKQFSDEASLKQHTESSVHKTVPSSTFGFLMDNISQKQQTNHNTQKSENISSVSDVGQEVGSSKQRKISCTLCQKQFSDEASLKQHMESSVHKTVPSSTFGFLMDNISQKQQTNHNTQKSKNISSVSDVGQEVGSSKQRKISCTLCEKQFSDEASLKQHMESSVHKTVPSSTFGFLMDNISQKQQTNHNTQKSENISSVSDVGKEVGSSKQRKITCTLCQKQFSDEASLKQHMESSVHKTVPSSTFGLPIDKNPQKQHTNPNTQDQENISSCEVQSKSTNILNQDSESNRHKKNKCTICLKEFAAPKDLQQHLDSSVHETKSIRCNECGSMFLTLKSLQDHLNSPRHQSRECSICMRIFASKDALDQHLKKSEVHKEMVALNSVPNNNESNSKSFSSETDVTCNVCGAVFTTNSSLKQHVNTGHTDLNYICEVCNSSFKSKNVLDLHMRDEHNHVFQCITCLKQFGTEEGVLQHIQARHENCDYFCPQCDKMFYYEFSLKDHMKKTGHVYSESVCTICFAKFASQNALEQHLNNTSHKYVHGY